MNENIDLTKILKDCPKGWKLYSTIYGDVTFLGIENGSKYPVKVSFVNKNNSEKYSRVTKQGLHVRYSNGECSLFPSKDQRDWSKFTAPWYNSKKQDEDKKERKVEQALSQANERAWLYLVSDVLTWKDGIGQYLDDPRVQELAKRLCSEYAQKLYNPSNTGKNEQKSADKIAPRFKVGDWVVRGDTIAQIVDIKKQYYVGLDINGKDFVSSRFLNGDKIHLWTINDAKDGDVLALRWLEDKNLWEKIVIFKKYHSEGVKGLYNYNMPCVEGYGITFKNGKTVFNERIPYYSKTWTCNLHPATKEQRDLLFQKMKEAGYKWNTETNTFEKFYL